MSSSQRDTKSHSSCCCFQNFYPLLIVVIFFPVLTLAGGAFFFSFIHPWGHLCFGYNCCNLVYFLLGAVIASASLSFWKKTEISISPVSLCPSFSSLFSCSQRNRCERADEPYRFAASLNQCVKATVYPDSIAVSEPSVPVSLHTQNTKHLQSQLLLATHYNEKLSPISIFPTHVQRQRKIFK